MSIEMADGSDESFWTATIEWGWTPIVVVAILGFLTGALAWAPKAAESSIKKSDDYAKLVHLQDTADVEIARTKDAASAKIAEAESKLAENLATIKKDEEADNRVKEGRLAALRQTLAEISAVAKTPKSTTDQSPADANGEYLAFLAYLRDKRPDDYAAQVGLKEKADALSERLSARKRELEKSGTKPSSDNVFKALEKQQKSAAKELADLTLALENEYFEQIIKTVIGAIDAELNGAEGEPGLTVRAARARAVCDRLFAEAEQKLGTL